VPLSERTHDRTRGSNKSMGHTLGSVTERPQKNNAESMVPSLPSLGPREGGVLITALDAKAMKLHPVRGLLSTSGVGLWLDRSLTYSVARCGLYVSFMEFPHHSLGTIMYDAASTAVVEKCFKLMRYMYMLCPSAGLVASSSWGNASALLPPPVQRQQQRPRGQPQ
jgi:hypothetical protein